MASFNYVGFDEMAQGLGLLKEQVHSRGPAAVQAGAEVARAAASGAAPRRTGGLARAVAVNGPFFSAARGHYCEVFPKGSDKRGQRYAMIGAILEYGRSNMPPRQWMSAAIERSTGAVQEAIAGVLMGE